MLMLFFCSDHIMTSTFQICKWIDFKSNTMALPDCRWRFVVLVVFLLNYIVTSLQIQIYRFEKMLMLCFCSDHIVRSKLEICKYIDLKSKAMKMPSPGSTGLLLEIWSHSCVIADLYCDINTWKYKYLKLRILSKVSPLPYCW